LNGCETTPGSVGVALGGGADRPAAGCAFFGLLAALLPR
jgi:hypothetical protein